MPESCPPIADSLDRHSVVAHLRRTIAAAEAMPRERLHRRDACPAGIPLELWFDDPTMADLYASRYAVCPPLSGVAPVRIYMLGHAGPQPAWADESFEAPAFHGLLRQEGLRAAYPHQQQVWHVLDERAGIGVHLSRAPEDLPLWHAGSPLRQHLHWLLQKQGKRIAHAATLGDAGRGILLLGSGGAGKSGTTLAGIAAGLRTVGDDYVALGGSPAAVATPMFRIVKQDRRGLAQVGDLRGKTAALAENWMGKVEFDPIAFFPDCFTDALEIRALVLPRIVHAEAPRLVAVSGGEAMRTLIPTNLLQFPGEPDDGMAYYAELARRLPAFRLELSLDPRRNGATLRDFIATL